MKYWKEITLGGYMLKKKKKKKIQACTKIPIMQIFWNGFLEPTISYIGVS